MTRVLMTADTIGGVWQYATDLARGLAAEGVAVDLAVLGPTPDADQRAALPTAVDVIDTGCPPEWLAPDATAVEAIAARVADLARETGADLVHLNQPALAVADFGVPVVAMIHSCLASWWEAVETGPLPADFAWQTRLVARGLARADAVAAPSRSFAAAVQRLYALDRAPDVILNGRYLPEGTGALAPLAFTAGRLWDRGKDVATLDRAAALATTPIEAAGSLAGPAGDAVRLDNVRALGRLSDADLAARLSSRPIFASAARYEPFGLAVLEAALAGCALVLADTPVFRELWNGAATFVDAGDAAGFARAIDGLSSDEDARLARGRLARCRALSFAPAAMTRATAALHARILAGERRVAA